MSWQSTEGDRREFREERAAIMQYCGNLSRKDAERLAGIDVQLVSLRATSEQVQARAAARKRRSEGHTRKEEQIALPGLEAAFGGG